ncbi:hypothetical protein KFU94_63330 [Chloroflexi bacterium TSY]|nr:hypothetical protein [Chloroflexi bacterium TSY]
MNRLFLSTIILQLMGVLLLSGCTAAPIIILNPLSDTVQLTTSIMKTHPARGDIEVVRGASSALMTDADSATFTVNATELVPGNVYTAWAAIVNKPELCASSPCTGPADILGNPDGVHSDMLYGDGQIADESGRATFKATLHKGLYPGGWFGYGVEDPRHVEIHVVLHDHGAPVEGMTDDMLKTFRGGCTDESLPAAFPEAAFSDGTPGPNACVHYQSTIFQQ